MWRDKESLWILVSKSEASSFLGPIPTSKAPQFMGPQLVQMTPRTEESSKLGADLGRPGAFENRKGNLKGIHWHIGR